MIDIQGSNISLIEPVAGAINVRGIIRTPNDKIRIVWAVNGASGSTECEAWRGQYEIECLTRAGYTIAGVSLA